MRKSLFWICLGFVVATFTTGCATSAPVVSQPYDQSANESVSQIPVMANGQQVAVAVLQKGQFHCEKGWSRAFLVALDGRIWLGCWQKKDGKLTARFEDGDELSMKVNEKDA